MATHTYTAATYNGISLRVIRTQASNIELLNFRKTNGRLLSLRSAGKFGINGAWYNRGSDQKSLNIALNNGASVGPDSDEGVENKVGRGVLA